MWLPDHREEVATPTLPPFMGRKSQLREVSNLPKDAQPVATELGFEPSSDWFQRPDL